jgi:hypothetical protein
VFVCSEHGDFTATFTVSADNVTSAGEDLVVAVSPEVCTLQGGNGPVSSVSGSEQCWVPEVGLSDHPAMLCCSDVCCLKVWYAH